MSGLIQIYILDISPFFWNLRQVLGCLLCWIISLFSFERERPMAFSKAHVPQTSQVDSSISSKTYPPQNHNIFAHSGKDMMAAHHPWPNCSRDRLSTCQGSKVNAQRFRGCFHNDLGGTFAFMVCHGCYMCWKSQSTARTCDKSIRVGKVRKVMERLGIDFLWGHLDMRCCHLKPHCSIASLCHWPFACNDVQVAFGKLA